jgi:tetrahydromethanopterin S-methyltransferase subunit B
MKDSKIKKTALMVLVIMGFVNLKSMENLQDPSNLMIQKDSNIIKIFLVNQNLSMKLDVDIKNTDIDINIKNSINSIIKKELDIINETSLKFSNLPEEQYKDIINACSVHCSKTIEYERQKKQTVFNWVLRFQKFNIDKVSDKLKLLIETMKNSLIATNTKYNSFIKIEIEKEEKREAIFIDHFKLIQPNLESYYIEGMNNDIIHQVLCKVAQKQNERKKVYNKSYHKNIIDIFQENEKELEYYIHRCGKGITINKKEIEKEKTLIEKIEDMIEKQKNNNNSLLGHLDLNPITEQINGIKIQQRTRLIENENQPRYYTLNSHPQNMEILLNIFSELNKTSLKEETKILEENKSQE